MGARSREAGRGRRLVGAFVWTLLSVLAGVLIGVASLSARPASASEASSWWPSDSVGARVRTHVDARLSRVAGRIAGRLVDVQCSSQADWRRTAEDWPASRVGSLGSWRAYTSPDLRVIHLPPTICAELDDLASRRGALRTNDSPYAVLWSVATLGHEAAHASGVLQEAVAECLGMQSIARIARALGRTRAEARWLATRFWAWYPRLDPAYRSPACRNGGQLDARPDSDVWP